MAMNSQTTDLDTPAHIRAEVAAALGLSPESIDPDQDLITQGLDSLRMMRLAGTWRKRGIDIDFARLAANPTINAWASLIGTSSAENGVAENPSSEAHTGAAQRSGSTQSTGVHADDIRAEVAAALGLSPESIDPHQDLIAQGLDSLRMMRLAGTWRKRGIDIDFARLAAAPSVTDWATLLGGGASTPPAEVPATSETADPAAPFPLAPMQHAYWIGRSNSHAFGNVAAHLYIEFDGRDIDPGRFSSAMTALLERHPMLRVRVLPDGTQQVGPAHPEAIAVHDLRSQSPEMVEQILAEKRAHGTHRTLPVDEGAVIRAELSLLPDGCTRVHLDVDMIAADAMSYRVLVDDFARLYRGERLPELGVTFATITADRTGREISDADLAWWRERIPHLPGAPELPLDERATRGEAEPHSVRLHHSVSASDWKRLEEHAHRRGVTPAAAVAAVFAEAVGTHSASPRFLLTVPLFDRPQIHPDVEQVVGDFTSSILIGVDLGERATLAERARQMRTSMHEAAAHGSMSGLDVLRELSRDRGEPVVSPIVFTSALGLGDLFSQQATDVLGDPSWIVSQGPQVLLDAQVTEVAGGLLLNWDVRASDLELNTARAMFDYYVLLLGLLVDGEWDVPAPDPLPAEVRAQRLSVESALPETDTFDGTLHGTVFARAAERADAPAVITDDRTWTHAELADEARRVAGALTASGVRAGDTVITHLPKGGDQVVAALGALAVGAAYVPIAPTQPAARRERIVTVATPAAVLTRDTSSWIGCEANVLDITAARGAAPADPVEVTGDALAYVLFTSGSTGLPKGVQVPHRAAVATITDLVDRYDLGADDRSLQVSSLEFDLSVFDIFGLLAVGGAVVVPGDDEQTKVDDWARLLTEHSVTALNCVPSILGMILDIAPLPSSLRMVIMGGDKVDVSLLDRVHAQLPDCRVAGLGGTTETAIHSTICESADVPAGMAFVPYGIPLRGVRCRVVDETGRDRPDLVPGELWIGGAGVADGYRGDPERTADRFVVHEGQKWYRTGDLARYLPGGFLDFLGRADHMVKVRGYRVELGEVEAGLLGLPEVAAAVAWSDGRDLRAAVVLADSVAADPVTDEAAVRSALAHTLPPHMVPRSVTVLDALPLTSNGKYDRKAIAALVDTSDDAADAVAPRNAVEEALVLIFGEVISARPIGVTDDFISLGGDSVQATRVVALTRRWLDAPGLSVADIFTHRTVAGLADRLVELDGPRATHVAQTLLDIMQLTDEQVDAEIARDQTQRTPASTAADITTAKAP
ncbi:amino acid adenylation domain-containing protein [Gordonia jinghuaiqii]|uniref:Phenyloxazoline synthase MbtB n=1 Tax=Gordonia jinghuaiqii TaxID=2758710 RepID=A0A7D7LSA6_9ACTN|nr:non-ribosomal peptide synthetase [Gordonia jinghuaiqii]MCR5980136.1 amino acid adenylation domain-containing protein [Gordonia jinghuaiqii]QMT02100.1 amino acid adenylation domain-containing protein [Gordonia jinghuaiqii]